MKFRKIGVTLFCLFALFLLPGSKLFKDDKSPEEQRQEILEMRTKTLNDLYKEIPGTKEAIEDSLGYAVFSSVNINVLAVSTVNGTGVLHNKKTGKDIYMKMLSAGVGVGMGVKDFRLIFVFSTQESVDNFVNQGWESSGQADAAAVSDEKGDALALAIDVDEGIKLYQLTEAGIALQATIQGTKYWTDEDLN